MVPKIFHVLYSYYITTHVCKCGTSLLINYITIKSSNEFDAKFVCYEVILLALTYSKSVYSAIFDYSIKIFL